MKNKNRRLIDDKEIIEELSKAKAVGSVFLKDGPLAFVVIVDPKVNDVYTI